MEQDKSNKDTITIKGMDDMNDDTDAANVKVTVMVKKSAANGGEPVPKMPKLSNDENGKLEMGSQIDLTLNPTYTSADFTAQLGAEWHRNTPTEQRTKTIDGATIATEPYQICLLPDLLANSTTCNALVDEMVDKVEWSRKQMDLYEFYQSADLSSVAQSRILANFLQMLRRTVRPWLEQVTHLKLDYVSASCSMYTCGDYLLVHDDLLKDRQIAFVYYLSPWQGAEQWTESQGGCLEIFDSDAQRLPMFPVRQRISPKNNQFVFFKVGARSFHQVGEVTNFDYPRLTINGWFHGASNADLVVNPMRPLAKVHFRPPHKTATDLVFLLNEIYLNSDTRENIQKRIEDNSEICLYEFFRRIVFEQVLNQLRTDGSLKWRCQGPANAQNYEVLELNTARGMVAKLISLFTSKDMFALLREYTDLDLAGTHATAPTCSLEFQRWTHGNYTVLGDGAICEENTLDLIYYLNATEGVAEITYLSPELDDGTDGEENEDGEPQTYAKRIENEEDSVLLTLSPVDNALNIVYRCEGTTKFTKYVSHNTPLEEGPVYVLSCSYKE